MSAEMLRLVCLKSPFNIHRILFSKLENTKVFNSQLDAELFLNELNQKFAKKACIAGFLLSAYDLTINTGISDWERTFCATLPSISFADLYGHVIP